MTDTIQLEGTLEAVAGDDLEINCTTSGPNAPNAEEILLREGDEFVNDRIVKGDSSPTLVTFTLMNTEISDDGRTLSCGLSEFRSPARNLSILCKSILKLKHIDVRLECCCNVTIFSPLSLILALSTPSVLIITYSACKRLVVFIWCLYEYMLVI